MSVKAHSGVGRGKGKGNIASTLVSSCTDHQFFVMCKSTTLEDILCTLHIFYVPWRSEKLTRICIQMQKSKIEIRQSLVSNLLFGWPSGVSTRRTLFFLIFKFVYYLSE